MRLKILHFGACRFGDIEYTASRCTLYGKCYRLFTVPQVTARSFLIVPRNLRNIPQTYIGHDLKLFETLDIVFFTVECHRIEIVLSFDETDGHVPV